ncbi:MAG TPA: hypothetical protein IGR64_13515 [Leptolyngbyaceae cyanobacterium M65_K2018_010]|nr:hypothetical protein [Leptolyngbyaceae cyanobacterium M65_K2018_010]
MPFMFKPSLLAALALAVTAPVASASAVTVTTDRVQVRTGENGTIQIRTLSDRPVVLNADADGSRGWPSAQFTPAPYRGICYPRSHSSQTQSRQVTPHGDRIYTESHSSIRLCQ